MSDAAFRRAVEAQDLEAMIAELDESAVLHSPVSFKPINGSKDIRKLFGILMRTFEDFHYTDELSGNGTHALIFKTRVGDREVEGMDLLRYNDAGKIEDFTVMVRPLSAALKLAETVGPQLAVASPDASNQPPGVGASE